MRISSAFTTMTFGVSAIWTAEQKFFRGQFTSPESAGAKPLAEANKWLEGYRQFREQSFERLDALLEERKDREKEREVFDDSASLRC